MSLTFKTIRYLKNLLLENFYNTSKAMQVDSYHAGNSCYSGKKVIFESLEPRVLLSTSTISSFGDYGPVQESVETRTVVIIDDDFDDATVSAAHWNESTYGSLASFSVNYDTTNRPSEVVLGLTCETSGTLGEVEITNKAGISAANAAIGPITQTLTIGSFSNGGTGEMWLIGDDGSSGTFDRNATNGGYIRVTFAYTTGAVNIYARGMGDAMQTLLSTTVSELEENDVFSVAYDSDYVASLTFYDASLDTTSNLVSSPIAHGLDFATDYANGAYTALSLYTWSANIVTYHAVEVTYTSEQETEPEETVTTVVGSAGIAYHNVMYMNSTERDALIESVLTDLAGNGFSICYSASPDMYISGILGNVSAKEYSAYLAEKIVEHGLANACALRWRTLLPKVPDGDETAWLGMVLNPDTSEFVTPGIDTGTSQNLRWNFGSSAALDIFASRAASLFDDIGQFQMFIIDEQIIAAPGSNAHYQDISTYWTSPTYSLEALGSVTSEGSFRYYLASVGYPDAATAKFPVTTIAVAPNDDANEGLPAISINASNSDRLQADNNWPNSALWQYWYDWRTEVYAAWVDAITAVAYDAWGDQPGWQGCAYSAPNYWYDPALGVDIDKIAALEHVDYLVAGYYSGTNYNEIREAALEYGKEWGGDAELVYYGRETGNDPEYIIEEFQEYISAGATFMYVYCGCNFRTDRMTPRSDGLYYMPDQVAAWADCVDWLEGQGMAVKDIPMETDSVLLMGDANRDGVVSAGDYASVQANFGNVGESGILGDANGDGVVSAGDYASVQANFGNTESATTGIFDVEASTTSEDYTMFSESEAIFEGRSLPDTTFDSLPSYVTENLSFTRESESVFLSRRNQFSTSKIRNKLELSVNFIRCIEPLVFEPMVVLRETKNNSSHVIGTNIVIDYLLYAQALKDYSIYSEDVYRKLPII